MRPNKNIIVHHNGDAEAMRIARAASANAESAQRKVGVIIAEYHTLNSEFLKLERDTDDKLRAVHEAYRQARVIAANEHAKYEQSIEARERDMAEFKAALRRTRLANAVMWAAVVAGSILYAAF